MANFPIFTPPSPAPFFDLPKQPNYSAGIAAGISGIGDSFRANRAEDFAAQKLADENAYRNAELETTRRGQDITAAHYATDAAAGPKYFGNPIAGTDKAGNPALFVYNDQGEAKQLPLPGGATPGGKLERVPMGLYDVMIDKSRGDFLRDDKGAVLKFPKNVAGVAAAKAEGAAAGTAAANLPVIDEVEHEFNTKIDEVLNDPALDSSVGPIEGQVPEGFDITGKRQRVRGNIRYIVANAFTVAYEKLKGAGPVSEGEGDSAKAAISKLDNITVDDDTYRGYLAEAKARMHALAEVQRKKARTVPQVTEEPFNPDGAPAATAPAAPGGNDPLGIR